MHKQYSKLSYYILQQNLELLSQKLGPTTVLGLVKVEWRLSFKKMSYSNYIVYLAVFLLVKLN